MHVTLPYSMRTKMTLYGVEFIVNQQTTEQYENEMYRKHFLVFDKSFSGGISDVFPKACVIEDRIYYYDCKREEFCQLVLDGIKNWWPIREIGVNLLWDFPYKELACQFGVIQHFLHSNINDKFLFGLQTMNEEVLDIMRRNFTRRKIRKPRTELTPKY